jgi:murein DD-endopeptidase MepM/ murein hydrolase activator NlpD
MFSAFSQRGDRQYWVILYHEEAMSRIKGYFRVVVVLCLFFAALVFVRKAAVPGNVYAITSDSIEEKQAQVNQAKEEIDNLQRSLSDAERIKRELESERGNLRRYVAALDASLVTAEENIEDFRQQIEEKEQKLYLTSQELEEAQAEEEKQYELMRKRIIFMYESGDFYLLEYIFSGESLTEMLNYAEYVKLVLEYDQRMMEEYRLNRQYVELCKQQMELEKEYLDAQKLAVEQERQTLEDLIREKSQEISRYESNINNKEQAIREFREDIEAQEVLISTVEAAIMEEKRRLLASSQSVIRYDGGVFKFPLATYTRVSDDYGTRMHPILGIEHFHNGVDFAAPSGTAIYAAYDGRVVASEYNTTMGNYVMIDHGDGLYTIYMHASALHVKDGDLVVKGETIAAVGSTGRSTGNHLHFSVRQNGSYVSPWNYLSQ